MFLKLFSKKVAKGLFSQILNLKNKERGALPIAVAWTIVWAATAITGLITVGGPMIRKEILDFVAGLLRWIVIVFVYIGQGLSYLATSIFDESLTWLKKPITTEPAFLSVWGTVRDLSNMIIVLGFVVVGIATSLRMKDYEAKKLLLPLILVALLINFSGLFCGLIIDASNIVSNSLIESGGVGSGGGGTVGGAMGARYHAMLNRFAKTALYNNPGGEDEVGNQARLMVSIQILLIYLVCAATFFYMAFLYVARYAVLAFLFTLAPLAFVCKVFPLKAAQKIWNDWWENFLKWAFIGVAGSFALWVSSKLISTLMAGGQGIKPQTLIVMLIFLVVGFKIMTKSSGVGASAVVGLAGGALGFAAARAWGATKGVAKIADKRTGGKASAGIQQLKSGYGRTMENLGLRKMGTTADANSKAVDAEAGLMAKGYTIDKAAAANGDVGAQNRVNAVQKLARDGRGAKGAAAVRVITEAKDINDTFANRDTSGKIITGAGAGVDLSRASQRLGYAEATGATGLNDEAKKQNYQFAGLDIKKVQKVMRERDIKDFDTAKEVVIESQLDANIQSMDHSQLRGIEARHLTADRISKLSSDKLAAYKIGNIEQIDKLQKQVRTDLDTERRSLEAAKRTGKRIDEGKLTKLTNQINEIDNLA